ncbi:MAG: FtsX-like permease family protein, partial [Bacteroidota bacterium]
TLFTSFSEVASPTLSGNVNSVILSEDKAKKYFGETNPIGQTILIRFSDDQSKTFIVSGVAKDFPASISFNFHFLIHFDNIKLADPNYDENDWGSFVEAMFIYAEDTTGVNRIAQQMDSYKALQNQSERDWQVESFTFEPLATLHKRSANIRNAFAISSKDGHIAVIFLSFVGIFLLALACFNYINIAIVSATKRLKEIGIRKTIGANRRIVIVQFLSENLITTSFALGLGVLLGVYLFIPWFESLFYFDMGFRWADIALWIYISIVLLITAIMSGIYPAFYISKLPVTGILKGALKLGKKNSLTRVILGFQLVLACLFITCAIMFTKNAAYLANRSWGYNEDLTLYTSVPDLSAYNQLEALMQQERDVLSVSGSSHHLGQSSLPTIIQLPSQDHEAEQLAVDASYFSTMGVELQKGRLFRRNHEEDKKSIIVNEVFARDILEGSTIGKTVKIDSNQYSVIGVVKDFHADNFDSKVVPTFFKLAEKDDFKYLSLKVTNGKQQELYKVLEQNWRSLFPETPFSGGYQEDVWGMYFVEIGIYGKVWRGIATIAILLAALGLYGLVTLNVSGRVREFSIRKVLGADVYSLALNITKQYVVLFIVALSIAAPISYFLISFIFDITYTYHIPIGISGVSLAVFILISILLVVIISQLSRISKANPVQGLKVE